MTLHQTWKLSVCTVCKKYFVITQPSSLLSCCPCSVIILHRWLFGFIICYLVICPSECLQYIICKQKFLFSVPVVTMLSFCTRVWGEELSSRFRLWAPSSPHWASGGTRGGGAWLAAWRAPWPAARGFDTVSPSSFHQTWGTARALYVGGLFFKIPNIVFFSHSDFKTVFLQLRGKKLI